MKAATVMVVVLLVCGLMLASAAPQFGGAERCRPGTVVQRDCNKCTCTSTGVLACTFKACIGGSSGSSNNRPRPLPGFSRNGRFPPNFGPIRNFFQG